MIGRAVRFGSHSGLPEKDRIVDVYHMILKKPSLNHRKMLIGENDIKPSADEILQGVVNEKGISTAKLNTKLIKLSISSNFCKTHKMVDKLTILTKINKNAPSSTKHKGNALHPQ